jgi:D-3-phosphoglycerate dehydrogenase
VNILVADYIHPLLIRALTDAGHCCDDYSKSKAEDILHVIHHYEGIVIRSKIKLDKAVIEKASMLKWIARIGSGMESIDKDYANSKGIKCLNSPEGNRNAVAEHALGLLLSLFNNICKSNQEIKNGRWIRAENRGTELSGKTVGIIGCGNTGTSFARCLRSFDVKVLAYDKYKQGISNEFIRGVDLDILYDEADILSLHLPLTEETNYMINKEFIGRFKKNIYLINTSRGKIVKTDDLINLLRSGKIKGAALDVLEYEDVSFQNLFKQHLSDSYQYLIEAPNIILTPHIAGWTYEAEEKMAKVLLKKINALILS